MKIRVVRNVALVAAVCGCLGWRGDSAAARGQCRVYCPDGSSYQTSCDSQSDGCSSGGSGGGGGSIFGGGGGGGGVDRREEQRAEAERRADRFLEQADDAVRSGYYDRAIDLYKKALNAYYTKANDRFYKERIRNAENLREGAKRAQRDAEKAAKEARAAADRERKLEEERQRQARRAAEEQRKALARAQQAERERQNDLQRQQEDAERERAAAAPVSPAPLPWAYGYPIDEVPSDFSSRPSVVRLADRTLIGGTGWVAGYYVPPGRLQLTEAEQAMLDRQLGIDGRHFAANGYNMVVGVAASYTFIQDLANRVVGLPFAGSDQNSEGHYSAQAQALYASLKGTSTSNLDCHSNGAMVCLEALSRGHVTGMPKVRLFGPQLTPKALAEWSRLLAEGTINGLEIDLMKGDPIGPASFAFGDAPWRDTAAAISPMLGAQIGIAESLVFGGGLPNPMRGAAAVTNIPNFWRAAGAEGLADQIHRADARIDVKVLESEGCRWDGFVGCHDIERYLQLRDGRPRRIQVQRHVLPPPLNDDLKWHFEGLAELGKGPKL